MLIYRTRLAQIFTLMKTLILKVSPEVVFVLNLDLLEDMFPLDVVELKENSIILHIFDAQSDLTF
jgi:hypothetical protein